MRKATAIAIVALSIPTVGYSGETAIGSSTEREQTRTPSAAATDAVATNTFGNLNTSPSTPPPPPLPDEEQQQAVCAAMWSSKWNRVRTARAAEPKDPAWAYAMEEKVRNYTVQRFQGTQIDVVKIDCRTSYCDIAAQGAADTAEQFSTAISAVAAEPWSDFSEFGSSHSRKPGKVMHYGTITRKQPAADRVDAVELACMELASQRANREQAQQRAAEDAEPRDASWADPTEQLLRQHIVGLLVGHPVDRLDIKCKTTFCKIEANGHTRESLDALMKATKDAAAQPWAESLWLAGANGGESGDRWEYEFPVYRRDKMNR